MADTPDTNSQAPPNETDREREKRIIKSIIESSDRVGLQEGHTYCLIAAPWWSSWQRYVVYHAAYMTEGERPGPIDNAFLLDTNQELRVNEIQERVHFHYLPKEAWDLLFGWYGGGPMIDRICIKTWNNYLTIELKKLKLSVIWSRDPKNILVRSFGKSTPINKFLEEMRKEMRWNRKNIRVIDFYQARRTSTIGPERWHKSLEECQIMDKQYVLIEEKKKNGQWPDDSIYKHLQNQQSYYTAPPSPPGQTGLNNLGNTCFMNSALQCLSAAVPLTDFFLSGNFAKDVNTTNPLGMSGEIAREYRNFLGELWSSAIGSHAPRAMKGKIERFAPQFGGYQQHDSQELLAFLLDGLHEDLNRIQKKPPVEVLDTWGPEEAWEGHKKRNDSVIVDLFQGQLKSRLRCPNNQRLSNVYDPFMYLTVQLPVDNSRKIVITVYRMDPKIKPLKICVTVDKDGTIKDVKKSITAITSIKPECIALVDVGASKFYREWKDDEDAADIRETDTVAAHEIVPTPPKTTKVVKVDTDSEEDSKEGSEESETVRIVILHKRLGKSSGYGFGDTYFGTPLILCVPTDITYKELYCRCIDHLSGGAPEGATSGGIWKEIPSKQVTTDPPPVDAPPSDPGSFSDNTVFELEYTQTPGHYQKLPSCVNDDYPLRLPDRRWVQLVWQTPLYKRFIDEQKTDFPEVEVHESCKGMVSERNKTRSTVSLTECLNLFNEEEQLSENDSWYCSDCKSHVQAYKQFTIWKAPKLLVIHLKRFSYRGRAFRERLDHLVEFPFKDLDMGPYIEGPKDYCTKYDLYAVSNHFGSLGGGHYTAYAKSRDDDTWFQFDDSNVSTVRDTSNIVSSAAYVLFYKRQDVDWPAFDPAFDQARKVVQEAAKEEAPVNVDDEYDPPSSEEEVVQAAVVVQDNTGQADSGEGGAIETDTTTVAAVETNPSHMV